MGLFTDSLKVSSGLTLGHAATQIGIQKTLTAAEEHAEHKFRTYQEKFFDPIVRDDLCHLEVEGQLKHCDYPFPGGGSVLNLSEIKTDVQQLCQDFDFQKVMVFVKNHPWLLGMVLLMLTVPFGNSDMGSVLGLSAVVLVVRATIAKPKKYQKVLLEDAKQYWKIREYLRNALIMGELTPKESVKKLLNARLVQRFPDTIEEIEAYAFNYKHGLK